ncbi:glycoside hydrolase family 3 protein [Parvularcula dongshanensis]|uniref:Beta-glucosidase n=1 Tax=Parvularcula dongshanensis TaxID=1173995 RepID=A0A840I691_9PROT|nr:glycoside hydrolase family 3 protein [Parvularcula dongshanensis]MBB4659942.1 beta-glucosidase [Parvularcula dongshanensis]
MERRPEDWPELSPRPGRDEAVEARIDALLAGMTLEEKVGQTIQADLASIVPDDLLEVPLGSVLCGGNSAPGGDNYAGLEAWLETVDAFHQAALRRGGTKVPILWGTDAVHGHNNLVGATIFPHNIGLGCADDPGLIRRIGEVTAREVQACGMDWTFAPTLATPRDDRWGRTYEGYSEDPRIVRDYAAAMVEGLQGAAGTEGFLRGHGLIATAKHFVGDGGTEGGKDQGDTLCDEATLREVHAAGYPPAIEAGVQTIMASFNSWHGERLHGHRYLLTEVLKGRMGFDGVVIGDWNGHAGVEGCRNDSCPAAYEAGVDVIMAPDDWRALFRNTLEQVREGEIAEARIDDAVRRVLRVKLRYGLWDRPRPTERPGAGNGSVPGRAAHRAVAREAVAKSLVLLKNDGVLPIKPSARVLVAGDAASIQKACGGWTLTWQGEGNTNDRFPNGQSIWDGLREAVEAGGGTPELSEDGRTETRPDVAIVVFGEEPYAEFQGDRENLDFTDDAPLALLKRLRADGIPTVSVFLSGRPLHLNPEINASNAFVAAWLPGSEGGGVADVLVGDADGRPRRDFAGKLSFSWPRHPHQTPLNAGEGDGDPLFAYGFGLTYADDGALARLDESGRDAANARGGTEYLRAGRARPPYKIVLSSQGEDVLLTGPAAKTTDGALSVRSVDRAAQEDARELTFTGPARFVLEGPGQDLTREANGRLMVAVHCEVREAPGAPVRMGVLTASGEGAGDVTDRLRGAAGQGWVRLLLPLSGSGLREGDLAETRAPLFIKTAGRLTLRVSDVRLEME